MDAEADLPHSGPQTYNTPGIQAGQSLLELDANARHDSNDAYVSVHGAFPPCAERAEQSGKRLRRKGCGMARKP